MGGTCYLISKTLNRYNLRLFARNEISSHCNRRAKLQAWLRLHTRRSRLPRVMSRAGVGLSLVEGARGELIVERVNPGGPAALEGSIRPGDQIVGVNGVPAIGMKIKDVAPHITGPPLTLVEIIVLRQGFQIPVRIQRGSTVPPPAAQTQRPPTAGSQYKGSQRLGGESAAGRDPRALAAEAAMKRQVRCIPVLTCSC